MDDSQDTALFDAPTLEDWQQQIEKLAAGSLQGLTSLSEDGLIIKPLYTDADSRRQDGSSISLPRLDGDRLKSRLNHGWGVAQFVSLSHASGPQPDAERLNQAILSELENGVGEVLLPPAEAVFLEKHPGIVLQSVLTTACQISLDRLPLDRWPAMAAALLPAEQHQDGHKPGAKHGGIITAGCFAIDPLADRLQGVTRDGDAAAWAKQVADDWQPLGHWLGSIGTSWPQLAPLVAAGDRYHCLGLTDGDMLASMLATTMASLHQAAAHRISPSVVLGRMNWRLGLGADLYNGIITIRAARLLLDQLARQLSLPADTLLPPLHAITSPRGFSRIDADNNMLRQATAALAAGLGGADRITCLPHDWLTGSSAASARLARNTQAMLIHEARLNKYADAAAGSFYLDNASDALARHAWQRFQELEALGGAMTEAGLIRIRNWAETASSERNQRLNCGMTAMLGVTRYPADQPETGTGGTAAATMLAPLVSDAGVLRGGDHRPAAAWEACRERVAANPPRLLMILPQADAVAATEAALWHETLALVGARATETVLAADEEPMEAVRELLATAQPSAVLLGGRLASHALPQSGIAMIAMARLAEPETDRLRLLTALLDAAADDDHMASAADGGRLS